MSTARLLVATQRKAKRAGPRVRLLPESFDVDDEGDLVRLRELLRHDQLARWLPATAEVLDAIDLHQ